ncbi:hypothetical protein GPS45_04590 [Acinetobacter haemolyticus]|uniref:sugar-transfer associated ATP-grasp domain-containing protein n=1 Tax=Acinetobacter haemolyticus TaxID=29430 RepID=UPI0013737F4C|nr:sugar-transfer associated ATP-grasp domain-containing protein [Acinetobacter haemolyticus]NAR88832.1 hypothetical protein [Acinetobacter haemolyticus]
MHELKKIFKKLGFLKNFVSVYWSFYKRHRSIIDNEKFKLIILTKEEKKDYLNYWKEVGPFVSLKTVEISKSLSGRYNKFIIPEEFFPLYFEPFLNKKKNTSFLENKSFYNKWFGDGVFPECFLFKIDGVFYDREFFKINDINSYLSESGLIKFPLVIKPTIDTLGGRGVVFVENEIQLLNEILIPNDLVVQEKIIQSNLINKFYKESISSVRVCLLIINNIPKVINVSLRMGKDGSLDNITAGGMSCNISESGVFNWYAVDKIGTRYIEHPNTKVIFKGQELPFYEDLKTEALNIANKVHYAHLISLDMYLNDDNKWKCLEINLFGQTIRFAQYAGVPFFGSLTQEIVNNLLAKKEEK